MRIAHVTVAAFFLTILVGCAAVRSTAVESKESYDKVYAAAVDAVGAVGYTVTSSNKSDGLIVAQQGIIGGSTTMGLNVRISSQGGKRIVRASFATPPGTITLGSSDAEIIAYVNALQARVPDLQPHK